MPQAVDMSNLIPLREAAELLGRSRRTIRRWAAKGDIKAYRVKRRLLIDRDSLMKMVVPAFQGSNG